MFLTNKKKNKNKREFKKIIEDEALQRSYWDERIKETVEDPGMKIPDMKEEVVT